jgi:hypothetical protein
LVFILKHYREPEDLVRQMSTVWERMAGEGGRWREEVKAKAGFAAARWWDQKGDKGEPPKCSGF